MLQHASMASYKIFKSNWSGHLPASDQRYLLYIYSGFYWWFKRWQHLWHNL